MKKTVSFYSLGCKINAYDTEVLREIFENNGYEVVPFSEKADVYIINTCTVTHFGDKKSRQIIRRARRNNPDALIVVTGCYAQVSPEKLEEIEEIDLILGVKAQANIIELINNYQNLPRKMVLNFNRNEEFINYNVDNNQDHTRAYVKVQDGCQQFCTYCIVPYARGPIRSRTIKDAVNEVTALAQNGYKEIVLTGVHLASYEKKSKHSLEELVEAVSQVKGIERIRLSSLEPTIITEEFLKALAQIPSFCPHFHLSLQSGSNSVLKRMNRHYSTKIYKNKVDLIRKHFPNAGITTDIIVGFPGETDKEFEETKEFIQKIGFSKIHIFPYSPREGTPAAIFNNQVDSQVKNQRIKELNDIEKELRMKFYKKNLESKEKVLYERGVGDNKYLGYTRNYIPVITYSNESLTNQHKDVKLKKIQDDRIVAEIL